VRKVWLIYTLTISPPRIKKDLALRTKHVHFAHRRTFGIGFAHAGREIAMTQASLRLVEGTFMDKMKALDAALSQSERAVGNGSIMRLGKKQSTGLAMIEAIEPEVELFALAEQVDLAEKAFHDALARRNEAQIAYLRAPSIMTYEAFEAAKTAEAVALEILDTEIRWLASTRAPTVIGLKLKAIRFHGRQARRQHRRRHLATLTTGWWNRPGGAVAGGELLKDAEDGGGLACDDVAVTQPCCNDTWRLAAHLRSA
jgi:hypothetical protein